MHYKHCLIERCLIDCSSRTLPEFDPEAMVLCYLNSDAQCLFQMIDLVKSKIDLRKVDLEEEGYLFL